MRKAAGRRLAETGCTAREIMAVLGHKTLNEAERYTRDADQAQLATSLTRSRATLGTKKLFAFTDDVIANCTRKQARGQTTCRRDRRRAPRAAQAVRR